MLGIIKHRDGGGMYHPKDIRTQGWVQGDNKAQGLGPGLEEWGYNAWDNITQGWRGMYHPRGNRAQEWSRGTEYKYWGLR